MAAEPTNSQVSAETEQEVQFIHSLEFRSQGLAQNALVVAGFTGHEEISKLYEFEIDLRSDDPNLDLRAPLEAPAIDTPPSKTTTPGSDSQ